MENFIVSARKYRPVDFEAVVGQQAITSTLENAIEKDQLPSALLFCGPRGVGKTTCARILAKKINQKHSTAETIEDPDFAFNIFELDAASNNSVDDIRNLIDQVRFSPQSGKYKVYIIDEVHMLSKAAFNAFLKTLEEPPPHAIFILATTEKHKIIPTILSRCQIYDFKRITTTDICNHLEFIAQKEGVSYQKEALYLIAQKADGALRDALSIYDRMVSFTLGNLDLEKVSLNLNILDYDYYLSCCDHVLKSNLAEALLLFDGVLDKGFDGHLFVNGLSEHFRNLIVAKDPKTIGLLEMADTTKEKYQKQAESTTFPLLFQGLEICNKADVDYKNSKNKRLTVEIALMQLCSIETSSQEDKKKSLA
ncbi:MAG: DNA polymerase III, subunit gamma and tau [Flavobacteriaceae bacterium]|nr:MAG: DNA polymerase III, subunit gamma and tau [Flavobacteriaceae bacterium]